MRARFVLFALVLAACGEAEANPVARPFVAPRRPMRVRVAPPPPPLSQTAAAVAAAANPPLTRPTEMAVTGTGEPPIPGTGEPPIPPIHGADEPATPTPTEAAIAAQAAAIAPAGPVPLSPNGPAGSETAGVRTEADAANPESAPIPTPPEVARAHELVSRWLVAQNEGRFDDYASLYSESFQGVKRSGARVRRFDRAGWLTDRRGMFGVAMHVQARDLDVRPSARGTIVRFTQVFRAARYHDEGPKQLLLVEESGRLAIAREEMMQSRLGEAARPAAELSAGSFMLAVHHGAATWLVLSRRVEPSWAQGDPTLVERGDVVVTSRAAVPGAMPAELAALAGSDVRLFGARAEVCSGRITELAIMRRSGPGPRRAANPPGGTPEAAADAPLAATSDWERGAAAEMLVGKLDTAATACAGASWGRLAALPFPTLFVPIPPPPPVAAHALDSFRLLPSWRALQQGYATAAGAAPGRNWDEHGSSRPTVTLWSDSTTQWVSVSQSVAFGGCDRWRGRLWALFEVEENGLALRTDVTDPGYHLPVAATDADGDGTPDFVSDEGLVRRRGAVHQLVDSLAVAHDTRDCGARR